MKKIINKMLKIFEKKIKLYNCYLSDLKIIFSSDKFKVYKGSPYPEKFEQIEQKIYAYSIDLMISENDFKRLKEILFKYFKLDFEALNNSDFDNLEKNDFKKIKSFVSEGIAIAKTNEFNGIVIYLLTNNIDLLNDIDLAEFAPPPPWVVFPNEDARGLGSMQGSMEYWFFNHWNPFWNSLTFAKKRQYLKKFKPDKYWNYYLMVNPYYTKNSIENKQNNT